MDESPIHDREREFHDALAQTLEPANMPPRAPDRLEVALLQCAGDITDRFVLDLGCGIGDLSLELLQRGARVTGLDLSGGMVDVACRRVEHFLPDRAFAAVTASVEKTGLPDSSFDLIVGKWILHHVELAPALDELRRLLRPGGCAVFIENSGLNPLLMFARRHVAGRFGIPRFGTEDERPLDHADLQRIKSTFPATRLEFPQFTFFRLLDRQVLQFKHRRLSKALTSLDEIVYRRAPRMRRYSFRVVLVMPTG
jgi:SAM-dependent methyltransferase